jgi:hypothetical protein
MTLVLAARDERYRITRSTSCQQVTLKLISDLPLSPYGHYADAEVDVGNSPD